MNNTEQNDNRVMERERASRRRIENEAAFRRRNLDRIREIQARQDRERSERLAAMEAAGTRDPQAINDERNRANLEQYANIPKSGGKKKSRRTKKRKNKRGKSKRRTRTNKTRRRRTKSRR